MDISAPQNKQDSVRLELNKWLKYAQPGTRLQPERELAERFGVSRLTVREAVNTFVKDGLLVRAYGKGVYVDQPDNSCKQLEICAVYWTSFIPAFSQVRPVMIEKLESAINKHGGHLRLAFVHDARDVTDAMRDADGLILMHEMDPDVLPEGKPVAVMFNPGYALRNASYILIDDFLAGLDAAKYLIGLGHERLLFIGDTQMLWACERLRGMTQACKDAGLRDAECLFIDDHKPVNLQDVHSFMTSGITGIVCENDYVAMAVISALHKEGIQVPEDVSVVGFDDSPASSRFVPPLTTIRLPIAEAAEAVAEELKIRIDSKLRARPRKEVIPAELIVRKSCAAARKG